MQHTCPFLFLSFLSDTAYAMYLKLQVYPIILILQLPECAYFTGFVLTGRLGDKKQEGGVAEGWKSASESKL